MEEDVYVIRLKRNESKNSWSTRSLPSEDRYSASFVLGLGSIHVTLGAVSAVFAILALFIENEANQHAVGLWTGVLYVGCGVTGVLAYTRWYVKRQIAVFLATSVIALMASVVSLAITSYGVHSRITRLEKRRSEQLVTPFVTNFNESSEDAGAGTVTINLYVTTILELFLCLLSIRVAYKGYKMREYSFSPNSNNDRRRLKGKRRKQFILETDLPPGYSPGVLSGPDLLCHLTNPITNQYHVTRANPLCIEENHYSSKSTYLTKNKTDETEDDPENERKEDGFFSISTISMDDKVQRFLAHAVELAKQNSKSVNLEPQPIYGSVVA